MKEAAGGINGSRIAPGPRCRGTPGSGISKERSSFNFTPSDQNQYGGIYRREKFLKESMAGTVIHHFGIVAMMCKVNP